MSTNNKDLTTIDPLSNPKEVKSWRQTFNLHLAVWAIIALITGSYLFGNKGVMYAGLGFGLLSVGFLITEYLVGIFTKVRTANATAVTLLAGLKLLWWAGLFLIVRRVKGDVVLPVAIGFGAFLLSILSMSVHVFGLPKISSPKQ
jgi:hypothetical protein